MVNIPSRSCPSCNPVRQSFPLISPLRRSRDPEIRVYEYGQGTALFGRHPGRVLKLQNVPDITLLPD